MAKHAIVRTDNLFGTDVREGLVSFKYVKSGADAAIDNGNIVVLDGLYTNDSVIESREVFKATDMAVTSVVPNLILVASVEEVTDKTKYDLSEYTNEAGKICRGYRLHHGGVYSVTKEALDIASGYTVVVGSVIEAAAGTKPKAVATLTSGSKQFGTVEAIETVGRDTYYVIRVQ